MIYFSWREKKNTRSEGVTIFGFAQSPPPLYYDSFEQGRKENMEGIKKWGWIVYCSIVWNWNYVVFGPILMN